MSETFTENGGMPAASAEPVADPLAAGAAAGEVAPVEAVPAAPDVPVEPALDPRELQAELEYLRSTNEQLLTRFSQQQQQQQQQGEPQAGFDPGQLFDEFGQPNPQAWAQFLDSRNTALLQTLEQRLEQMQEPLQQQARAATEQHYAGLVDTLLDKNMGGMPADAREFVESRAAQLLPDLNHRFGTNPDGSTKQTVLELAIEKAAVGVRQLLGGAAGTAEERQAQRLATLAGATGEPGNGAGGAAAGTPEFKSPREVVEYYAQGGAGFVRNTQAQ